MSRPEIVRGPRFCVIFLNSFQATAGVLRHNTRCRFLRHPFQLTTFESSSYSTLYRQSQFPADVIDKAEIWWITKLQFI